MRLNPDCVRDVLLVLESNIMYNADSSTTEIKPVAWNALYENENLLLHHAASDIKYTVQKLAEAEFISVSVNIAGHAWVSCDVIDITWNGHEFLNTVRGKTIWEATKDRANKLGGFSLKAITTIASAIIQGVASNPNFVQEIINSIK
jgi:hypothetical protein